jgi:hypothetical protein
VVAVHSWHRGRREERKEEEEEVKKQGEQGRLDITFKGTPPVIYFFQLGFTP